MKFEQPTLVLILASAVALSACGDDGGGAGDGGDTSNTTDGGDDDGQTPASTMSMADSGSTAADDDTTGGAGTTGGSSSGGSSESDDGGSSDEGSSTGSVPSVTLSGVVSDFGMPGLLPNISVCVFEQKGIPCATTDDMGEYTLMGVPSAEGAIEFTGAGRFPSLFWGEGPTEDDVLDYSLLSNLAATVLAAALGEQIDDTLGHLALAVVDGDGMLLEGVTFTLSPDSGALGYLTTEGVDPKLAATSEVGFVGVLNVDVGETEVVATHATLDCVPGPGALVGATADALRIDVRAGYLGSTFPFVCS